MRRESKYDMDYIIQYSHRHGDFITFVMYKEAMRNTVLEHTLVFKEFPKSFQKVNVFLFLIFIEGSFRIC